MTEISLKEVQHCRFRRVSHPGGELPRLGDLPPELGDRIDDPRRLRIIFLEFGVDVLSQRGQVEAGAVVVKPDLSNGQDQDDDGRHGALFQTIAELSVAGPRLGRQLPEIETAPLDHRPRRQGEGLIHDRRVPGLPQGLFDLKTSLGKQIRPLDRRRKILREDRLETGRS